MEGRRREGNGGGREGGGEGGGKEGGRRGIESGINMTPFSKSIIRMAS